MMIDAGHQWATAFAQATVSNVAVGFDILGFALSHPGDEVTVRRSDEPGVRLVSVEGDAAVPRQVEANTATAGLIALAEDRDLPFGLEVSLKKGVALKAGLGGSAASAVAAVVAASAVLDRPLSLPERFHYALLGEQVSCGKRRADNLGPAMLGGMVLVRSVDPLDVVRVPVPHQLQALVVWPQLSIAVREARKMLEPTVDREAYVIQAANLAGFVAGCFEHDLELMGRSLEDVIIEPQRAPLVPGFEAVKAAAHSAGALGCSLAGAGPSVFALFDDHVDGEHLAQVMIAAFEEAGTTAQAYFSPIEGAGAHVVARGPQVGVC